MPHLQTARPELAQAIAAHFDELTGVLAPGLGELCRRRVVEVLDGVDSPPLAELTGVERDCLVLAEQFIHSAQWVTDEQVAAVARHLEPGPVVALIALISLVERTERLERFLAGLA